MVELGKANSRMKDFFDVFVIANTTSLSCETLKSAIKATFNRRETTLNQDALYIFSKSFKTNKDKHRQWKAFLKKNRLNEITDFTILVEKIQQFIEPVYLQAALDTKENKKWNHSNWNWE